MMFMWYLHWYTSSSCFRAIYTLFHATNNNFDICVFFSLNIFLHSRHFFFSAKKIIVQCQEHWFISWRSYAKHYASLPAVYYVWDAWSLVDFLIYFLNMWNQIILLLHNHVKYTTFLLGYLYEGRWQQKLIKKWCIQIVMVYLSN